jgi:hypothetical protein
LGREVDDLGLYTCRPGYYEITLEGSPWLVAGVEMMKTRDLLLALMGVLEHEGWTVYASIDRTNGGETYVTTDDVSL